MAASTRRCCGRQFPKILKRFPETFTDNNRKCVRFLRRFHSVSKPSIVEASNASGWYLNYISRRFQYTYHQHRFFRGRHALDTQDKCKDFVVSLFPNERTLVLAELQKLQELHQKKDKEEVVPPTKAQLRLVALSNGIPFIGFGFLDNAIMIVAGDYIDLTIGVTLGISTMAAAALGNLISDLAGVGLAGYVESIAHRIGVQPKELTPEQAVMRKTRWSAGLGRAVGLAVGCLLGMFPLLFLETRIEAEDSSKEGDISDDGDK
ncbi:transmembrane protein 65-like isoform X1 [Asterias rubens]|uniref:transmembrane protein 65-like isoform X1 n=1 Tax=Asterias rubens TaxID=7604 RepID=UPI00145542E3|nr:transmembrane protein 65-like isoform X1 [Asterias rubens]